MGEVTEWATNADGNALVAGLDWREGMLFSAVNNNMRELMAQVARWRDGMPTSDNSISLDPAEIIEISGASVQLDSLAYSRAVIVSGSTPNMQVNLPPADTSRIGDGLMLIVPQGFSQVVRVQAQAASGALVDGRADQFMVGGEVALVRWTGTQWEKIAGKSVAFTGALQAAAATSIPTTFVWTTVTLPTVSDSFNAYTGWATLNANKITVPRRGFYSFNARIWLDPAFTAPNYAAPVGTEGGVALDMGFAVDGTVNSFFQRERVFHGDVSGKKSMLMVADLSLNAGATVEVQLRTGSPMTTLSTFNSGAFVSRLTFVESPLW